jgi:hypothetical protein
MFPITVTITNPAQLNAVMAALNIDQMIGTPAADAGFAKSPAEALANAEKRKAAKKEPAQATVATNGASSTPEKTSSPADAAAQEPAAEVAPPSTPAAESVSYEDVKKAIIKLSQSKGRDAVVALLGEFNVNAGPALKPEQYAAFVAKAGA